MYTFLHIYIYIYTYTYVYVRAFGQSPHTWIRMATRRCMFNLQHKCAFIVVVYDIWLSHLLHMTLSFTTHDSLIYYALHVPNSFIIMHHISPLYWITTDTHMGRTHGWESRHGTSRLLKIIGLFCKRALWKRLYSAKETDSFKEPTNRSHTARMRIATRCCIFYLRHIPYTLLLL